MSPKNQAHVIATNRVCDALREKLAGRARVLLEVFRGPGETGYRRRTTLGPNEAVTPEAWPDVELEVAAIFP